MSELGKDNGNLRQRVILLEKELLALKKQTKPTKRPPLFLFLIGAVLTSLITIVAIGDTTTKCDDSLEEFLFCFSPNTPARAYDINHNFDQLTQWISEKVGNVTTPGAQITDLTVTTGLTIPSSSIGSAEITDSSVSTSDILDNTVSTNDILNGTITHVDLANNAIFSAGAAHANETTTPIVLGTGNTSANCFCALTRIYGSSDNHTLCYVEPVGTGFQLVAQAGTGANYCDSKCICW